MSDPDILIQKVLQKVDLFDLDIAIPTIPKRLKKEYEVLQADADKIIFRKLWEKATAEERKIIEAEMIRGLESSRSRSGRSRSRSMSSSRGYSDYTDSSRSRSVSRSGGRSRSRSPRRATSPKRR